MRSPCEVIPRRITSTTRSNRPSRRARPRRRRPSPRTGGGEFAVVAVDTDEDSASTITRRLAETLSEYNGQAGRRYALSFSVGVVRFDPTSPCSIEELFTRADEALYAQKRRKARL